MKILWVSHSLFDDTQEKQSGVWQKALATRLALSDKITLGSVSCKTGITKATACDYGNIRQWVIPKTKINRRGYPQATTINCFKEVIDQFKPDIIHVWGSENSLKLLPFEEELPGIKILEFQGVLSSIGPVLLEGLSVKELISTIGIRELLFRKSLFAEKRWFQNQGKFESIMIRKSDYISVQSDWTISQIQHINPNTRPFQVTIALRTEFLTCQKWPDFKLTKPVIFSAAVGLSLKGLHVLIRALAIVKEQYPEVELRLAGAIGRKDFLGNGYLRLILRMIRKHGLDRNVIWLGALTGEKIIGHLQEASVFVNPSFIESYSLVLAEAMCVGTPSVVSFAGAMPELAENNKEALFFTPGDYKCCAYLIGKLLSDKNLALKISENAIKRAEAREIKTDIVKNQIAVYEEIISLVRSEQRNLIDKS